MTLKQVNDRGNGQSVFTKNRPPVERVSPVAPSAPTTTTNFAAPPGPAVFQIIGFDRPQFVGDVANAVPQDEHCRITGFVFEADGVRVNGQLLVQVDDEHHRLLIDRQLRLVRGLVSVKQTN